MATKKTTARKQTSRKASATGSRSGAASRSKQTTAKSAKADDDAGDRGAKAPRSKAKAPAARARSAAPRSAAPRAAARGASSPADPNYPLMVRVEREIGGRKLSLETGRMAKLADGAVVARYGDTMVLATAQAASSDRDDIDFFPLTVDYREKAAAAGKFPGGFFKREGRPTTREILTCRIIDRSIRPLFADGFRRETQVLTQVLATDKENDSDVLAAVASFAALAISSIPNGKTLGAVRIGLVDGKLRINPTWSDLRSAENRLNLTVSAHSDAIVMVEAGADQVTEDVVLEALELAHEVCCEIADMIAELVDLAGKPKVAFTPPARDEKLFKAVEKKFGKQLMAAPVTGGDKHARGEAKDAIKKEVRDAFPAPADASEKEAAQHKKAVSSAIDDLFKQGERASILAGRRADGRSHTDIRQLTMEVGVLPRVHGSSLFTRGETQTLCVATLGTVDDQQFIDGIYPEDRRRWLLHYSFPPFSVGEVRRFLAPGRREIGHGALAERAVEQVLPPRDDFAYSLRVTSEVLESNGSSSMATVCGATLALMDAGVPIKQPVAGIAMGLVVEGKDVAIVSDILGSEDHCGDMDFKVAGTGKGITALQMDIKCEGLSRATLEDALEQARVGRLHILREMLNTIRRPRETVSMHAPRLMSFPIPADKIGSIIGPGGRTIRGMQEEFECRIAVIDTGVVEVCGADAAKVEACIARIKDMTAEVELGKVYKGRVTGLKEFGAFVEILPGQEGLVHVSELSDGFIRSVTDVVKVGEEIEVKVIDIDDFGKVKLSRRALLAPGGGDAPGGGEPRRDRGDRDRGDRDRGGRDRGGRDRGDRGPRRPIDADADAEIAPPPAFDDEPPAPRPDRPRRPAVEPTEVEFDDGPVVDAEPRRDPRPAGGGREARGDRGRRPDGVDDDVRPRRSGRGDRSDRGDRGERGARPPRDRDEFVGERPRRAVEPDVFDDPRPPRVREDFDDVRPRRSDRDDVIVDRPRRGGRDEVVADRPRRGGRDDVVADRPRRGERDDIAERPRRGGRDDLATDRPRRGGRDDVAGDRPRRGRDDVVADRPRRGGRDDVIADRPRRAERDDEIAVRPRRAERDDVVADRPSRGDRDDVATDRPRRPRGEDRDDRGPRRSEAAAADAPRDDFGEWDDAGPARDSADSPDGPSRRRRRRRS